MAKIGLRMPVYAVGTYGDDATTYTTGAIMGKAVSANLTLNRTGATLDADDGTAESDNTVTGGTMALTLDDMTAAVMADVLGYDKEEDGKGFTVKDSDSKYVGFGYIRKRILAGVSGYLVYWFYKMAFSQTSDEATTRAASGTSFQTMSLEGTLMKAPEGFYTVKEYTTEAEAEAALKALAHIA